MDEKQKRRVFAELAKNFAGLKRRMLKKYGPSPQEIGSEMDELAEIEDDMLELFGLKATGENQQLLFDLLHDNPSPKTITAAYSVLEAKGDTAKAQNLAPLEILLAGLSDGQNAIDVLPKLGFGNHVYQIFLYNLIFQEPALIVEIYNEMCRAEPFLGEIAVLKGQYVKLASKNIRWLRAFLESEQAT